MFIANLKHYIYFILFFYWLILYLNWFIKCFFLCLFNFFLLFIIKHTPFVSKLYVDVKIFDWSI